MSLLELLSNFWAPFFVWRKWEDSPEAMLISVRKPCHDKTSRLMLEQAKFAVLNRVNRFHRHHLKNALDWLQTYMVPILVPVKPPILSSD